MAAMQYEGDQIEIKPESSVNSLAQDKPKIAFHAAMMAIKTFGFFTMYYDIWEATPGPLAGGKGDPCASTRYACGMMALTCFSVTWLCVGMAYGGYISDPATHSPCSPAEKPPRQLGTASGRAAPFVWLAGWSAPGDE